MTAQANKILKEIRELPAQQRIELALEIWNEITNAELERLPVPDEHKGLLDERLAAIDSRPDDLLTWDEVQRAVEARLE